MIRLFADQVAFNETRFVTHSFCAPFKEKIITRENFCQWPSNKVS